MMKILILLVGKAWRGDREPEALSAEPVPEIVPLQIDLDEVLLASKTGKEAAPA
jgi:hypothetical protein